MIDKFFHLKERNTNFSTEILAGTTTFLTMSYIIFVNPNILSTTGMPKEALIVVTCLTTAISCIITGIWANAPIAMAPGMGLNTFFAYNLVLSEKIPWQTALGIVFLSGFIFFIITFLGLREKLVEAIPLSLVRSISVGIGLFITFIGLQEMGLVIDNPATLVCAGKISLKVGIGIISLLIMVILSIKKRTGALLIGIGLGTILSIITGMIPLPKDIFSFSFDISSVAFKLDIISALKWSLFPAIFALMFTDMFDSIGTLIGCCYRAGLVENGKIKNLDRLLTIDALATMIGALLGTSTTTSYIESASGIREGGRTGLTAVITGILFIICLPFIPVIGIVPAWVSAAALIIVGLFMMSVVVEINFSDISEGFPAFVIIVMIAFSYNISKGISLGFLSFVLIKIITGHFREIKPAMWGISILCLLFWTL